MAGVTSLVRQARSILRATALRFVHSALVHVLAGAALLAVLWSAFDVYIRGEPAPQLPVLYDLSLAYLTGWLFHVLVIVLPERRRAREIVKSVETPLIEMTAVGKILVDSLTYIGLCPDKEATLEHVTRVCTANNYNDATNNFIREVLSVAREAYARLEPRITQLPPDVAKLASDIEIFAERADAPKRRRSPEPGTVSDQPEDMRAPSPMYTLTVAEPTVRRHTLQASAPAICSLYEDCARLRAAVEKYTRPARRIDIFAHPFSDPWVNHKANDPAWPVSHYPATALSEEWPQGEPLPRMLGDMRIVPPSDEDLRPN